MKSPRKIRRSKQTIKAWNTHYREIIRLGAGERASGRAGGEEERRCSCLASAADLELCLVFDSNT